jgi:hypothetical protein
MTSDDELCDMICAGELSPYELSNHCKDARLAGLIDGLGLHDYVSLDWLCEHLTGAHLYTALRGSRFLNEEADADVVADLFKGPVLLEALLTTRLLYDCTPDWIAARFADCPERVLARALTMACVESRLKET